MIRAMGRVATAWVFVGCMLGMLGLGCGGDVSGTVDGGAGGSGGAGGQGGESDADKDTGATTCPVTAPTTCPTPVPYAQVEPIFSRRCVPCHNGMTIDPSVDAAIWPLTTYGHLIDWKDSIRGELTACSMPPVDAGSTLTVEERVAILQWLKCGAVN